MKLIELTEELHLLQFPVGNAYLWRDPDGLTLIDTGITGSGPAIADAIRELGHPVEALRRMVLTHFHADHMGSAAEIAGWGGVEVFAHRADAPFIRGEVDGPPPRLADWELPIFEQVHTQMPAAPVLPVRVDHEVDDGDVLGFGGGAQIIGAPGHTPGSIGVYLPGRRVLFTGDTVARAPDGQVMLGVFNAEPAQAAESFARLAELDAEIACFGHGEPLTQDAAALLKAASAAAA